MSVAVLHYTTWLSHTYIPCMSVSFGLHAVATELPIVESIWPVTLQSNTAVQERCKVCTTLFVCGNCWCPPLTCTRLTSRQSHSVAALSLYASALHAIESMCSHIDKKKRTCPCFSDSVAKIYVAENLSRTFFYFFCNWLILRLPNFFEVLLDVKNTWHFGVFLRWCLRQNTANSINTLFFGSMPRESRRWGL